MRTEPRSPQTFGSRSEPITHYHVVFWRQPLAPEGYEDRQERIVWAARECDVLDGKAAVFAPQEGNPLDLDNLEQAAEEFRQSILRLAEDPDHTVRP